VLADLPVVDVLGKSSVELGGIVRGPGRQAFLSMGRFCQNAGRQACPRFLRCDKSDRLSTFELPIAAMYPLEVVAFDLRFRARQQMRMPGYMGSAWRGGFGRALRRAVCVTGLSTCPGCSFEASCVYPCLFETRPGGEGGILAAYDRVPNPFVLAAPWDAGRLLPAGGETGLRLVLIGQAVEHAGFARQALAEAGLRGLGPDRGALYLFSADKPRLAQPQR
jgi:hypothetical protein